MCRSLTSLRKSPFRKNLIKICLREFYGTRYSTCTPVKNDGGVRCVKNILNRN
nr:MAG TPA: hypothetical protein [Caudoviricetes sp.]